MFNTLTSSRLEKVEGFLFKAIHRSPQLIRSYISHMRSSKVAQRTTPIYISQVPRLDKRGSSLKNKIKSLLYAECFSLSPIKPSIELGRSVVAMLKENFFLKYLNLSSPPLRARLSFPVNYMLKIWDKRKWKLH